MNDTDTVSETAQADDPRRMGADLEALEHLRAFVGRNADKYEQIIVNIENGKTRVQASWNWGAFCSPLAWLLYRKLYVGATIYFLVFSGVLLSSWHHPVSYTHPIILLLLKALIATFGKNIYIQIALTKTSSILKKNEPGTALNSRIKQLGGVSTIGAIVGAIAYVPAYLLLSFYVFVLIFVLTY